MNHAHESPELPELPRTPPALSVAVAGLVVLVLGSIAVSTTGWSAGLTARALEVAAAHGPRDRILVGR
jgi:hypothetical protein